MTINDNYTNTYTVWVGDTIQITYQWDYEVTPQCPDDSCIVQLYLGITGYDSMTCENIPQYLLGYQRLDYSAMVTEAGCHKIYSFTHYGSSCNSNGLTYSPTITILGALWIDSPSQSKLHQCYLIGDIPPPKILMLLLFPIFNLFCLSLTLSLSVSIFL